MSSGHFHALRVGRVEPAAADALAVTFDLPAELRDRFRFNPGQHLTLRRGDQHRAYSICAAPGEPLRVGVRRVPGGAFSNWLHETLRAGDTLEVMEPEGRFGAALAHRPRHLLAVAGGSGITPILSIVKSTLDADPQTRVTLLYGNRDSASTMFRDELQDLKNRHMGRLALHWVFSREQVDSPLQSGRLDAAKLADLLRLAGPVDQAFVCGPHAMNDEVEAALLAAGLPRAAVHVERFGIPPTVAAQPLPAHAPGDAAQARVRIVRDGVAREIAFEAGDGNILAAAARAGLDVPFSCKSGVCATCRAKLVEGRVRMERNFALEAADLEAGFVLACQSHPLTDSIVLSFDQR